MIGHALFVAANKKAQRVTPASIDLGDISRVQTAQGV